MLTTLPSARETEMVSEFGSGWPSGFMRKPREEGEAEILGARRGPF